MSTIPTGAIALIGALLLPLQPALAQERVEVISHFDGHAGTLVRTNQTSANTQSCPRNDYYILQQEHPLYASILSQLLTAATTGRSVRLLVNGCREQSQKI